MAGVTEYESYHLLDSVSLAHGMLEKEQHKVLLDYMKAKFEVKLRGTYRCDPPSVTRSFFVFFSPQALPRSHAHGYTDPVHRPGPVVVDVRGFGESRRPIGDTQRRHGTGAVDATRRHPVGSQREHVLLRVHS